MSEAVARRALQIEYDDLDQILTAKVIGRLDHANAEHAHADIVGRIDEGYRYLVLDFYKLDYISSGGLRTVLRLAKRLQSDGGALALARMSDTSRAVFEATGLMSVLTVCADVPSAVEAVRPNT